VVQTEPLFEGWWALGQSLGNRAGIETTTDFVIGVIGLLLVLEATRRSIGWIVPILAVLFMAHSYYCYLSNQNDWPILPDNMFPHAGQSAKDIVSTTYIQSLGVFGVAASVMFSYVFLFVVFGSFLEMSGATQFIIDFATKVFGRFRGGPAMVSVLASGLMGSLSGSAVANAVTTGSFTIPMMRAARFPRHVAGGITAAAASGGALVPPVMGAGAYMMLELIELKGGFLDIMKAAAIPAALFYISILVIVFLYSRRLGTGAVDAQDFNQRSLLQYEAIVFVGALGVLIALLALNFSPFRAVTGSLAIILVLATMRKSLALGFAPRILAVVSFITVVVAHQAMIPLNDSLPGWMSPFLANSWIHPGTESLSLLLMIGSLLSSAIVGMLGLLVFGLIHPAWRPEMLQSLTKSAKNGISLVAASACVGIIIGIVQQTGIATDFSAAIKGVVETNLFLALVGIMVETPAAALALDTMPVDFASIGSNDLTQYVMAASRDAGGRVAELIDPLDPAVLRLIRMVVEMAAAKGLPLSLCGDMASDRAGIEALVAIGIERVSVAPA
ncbi:MAG: TRAP transporter large permease subunit, partial [Planctomycetales bacterium]|nr:TRAP transporter large permease subunit [Planctomycetales bacterium]